jgi:RNA polymerase I-specific transcription initiation factor RRN6
MILPLQFSNTFLGLEGISPDLRLDYLETYNHLIDDWVTLLPHGENGIPDSTRVLKERSVRGITLDILLARLIRVSDVSKTARLSRESQSNDVPRTQQGPTLLEQHRSQELSSSQVTSTPKPSAEDKSKKPPATNYSALSTYTVFKQPRPMPQNVSNLLSHWQLGVDPTTYEWKKSSRLLDENKNQAAKKPTRQRLHKRRSQLLPETATATAAAPEIEPASSLPPTPVAPMIRAWGSQPDQPPMPIQSSQPTLDEEPMTQMERGLFGAREVKKSSKAAKKKRNVGF